MEVNLNNLRADLYALLSKYGMQEMIKNEMIAETLILWKMKERPQEPDKIDKPVDIALPGPMAMGAQPKVFNSQTGQSLATVAPVRNPKQSWPL